VSAAQLQVIDVAVSGLATLVTAAASGVWLDSSAAIGFKFPLPISGAMQCRYSSSGACIFAVFTSFSTLIGHESALTMLCLLNL
jgi:hypothetical protein